MKTIILDTNFLMVPYQFKVDIFSEIRRICVFSYELAVVDKTLDELNGIALSNKGKDKMGAKLAMLLLQHNNVKTIATAKDRSVDDLIVGLAGRDTLVATQDRELKKRVKAEGAGIIILRQKKYLVLE